MMHLYSQLRRLARYLLSVAGGNESPRESDKLFPIVYVCDDGSVRELTREERRFNEQEFEGGDSGRPYVKTSYRKRDGWGKIGGFCFRSVIPRRIKILDAPDPADCDALLSSQLEKSGRELIVLWADWNPEAQSVMAALENDLAKETKDWRIHRVDVRGELDLSCKCGRRLSVPTLVAFVNGRKVGEHVGKLGTEELAAFLASSEGSL